MNQHSTIAPPVEAAERPLKPAMLRGWRRRCPSCGAGPMMNGYLRVRSACPVCGEELHHHRADDGPAYLTILIVGHIMAPVLLYSFVRWRPDPVLLAAIFSVGTVALSLFLLPRLKGALVALQWAKRMHGFGSPCVSDRIRAAATVILWRKAASGAELLMGQRGASAVFMPSKYVFPGGAVDPEDAAGDATGYLDETSLSRLALHPEASFPGAGALVTAARRELQEETGLTLSRGTGPRPAMRFIFRAITPPGLPRRFDARFFLVDAAAITGDATNFTEASGELSHLHWIGLAAARDLDLPFITEIVLAETQALLEGGDQPGVPFFDNSTDIPTFHRIL